MELQYSFGATPLDQDEIEGLIPSHIYTQSQLNEWEQSNILEAYQWLLKRKIKIEGLLSIQFIQNLHYKMFGKTWRWAGKFRKSDKNIGIAWESISSSLKILIDDVHYQKEHTVYHIDEIAARFHHRLVIIHPFPNGNGRHARLMTDAFLTSLGSPSFTWGKLNFINTTETRNNYIRALRKADQHDYTLLLNFVRN